MALDGRYPVGKKTFKTADCFKNKNNQIFKKQTYCYTIHNKQQVITTYCYNGDMEAARSITKRAMERRKSFLIERKEAI